MEKEKTIINKLIMVIEKDIEKIEESKETLSSVKLANLVFETRLTMNQVFTIIKKSNMIIDENSTPSISKLSELDEKIKEYEANYHNLYEMCGMTAPKK